VPCHRPGRSRGFTLIEMIAAFVIFSIAVGALMQILTLSMNNARLSADETRAALWAQSLLDTVGVGERIEAGSSHGEFDRKYRWELQIEQIDPELVVADVEQPTANAGNANAAAQALMQSASAGLGMPQIDLFHVGLTVIWGDNSHERTAQFTTLRTTNPDPANPQSSRGQGFSGSQLGSQPRGGTRQQPAGAAAGGKR
jgi:general secretion pathway protein I